MSAWDRWDVPIKLQEGPLDLGTVSMPRIGIPGSSGRQLWSPSRTHASQQLNMPPKLFTVAAVNTAGGTSMTETEASSVSLSELKQQEAEVVLELPKGTPPMWLQKQEKLEQQVNQQQQLLNQQHTLLQRVMRRSSRLAMRALLDAARHKLNSGPLSPEDKLSWDGKIENMGEAQLDELHITRAVAGLTKYGASSVQDYGNKAAHDFTVEEIANAAIQFPVQYQELFQFVYGQAPGALAFPEGGEQQ